MRKARFRRPFRARSARSKSDSRQFNLCGLESVYTPGEEAPGESCANPLLVWTAIAYPEVEGTAYSSPPISRGIVFSSARWKYRYTLAANALNVSPGFYNAVFIRSALIMSPLASNQSPQIDPVTGSLPLLFNSNGDMPGGIRLLWRGLDVLSNSRNATYAISDLNVTDRYIPLERFNGKVRMREGMGLFWVSELIAGNPAANFAVVNDLSMSYRISNL